MITTKGIKRLGQLLPCALNQRLISEVIMTVIND